MSHTTSYCIVLFMVFIHNHTNAYSVDHVESIEGSMAERVSGVIEHHVPKSDRLHAETEGANRTWQIDNSKE